MIDIPKLVEMVSVALVRADKAAPDVPDYDALAAEAVRVVLEQIAQEAIGNAVRR